MNTIILSVAIALGLVCLGAVIGYKLHEIVRQRRLRSYDMPKRSDRFGIRRVA